MQVFLTKSTKVDATSLFSEAYNKAINPNLYRKSTKPRWSRFKLKFNYRDGNMSVHFSYDWMNDYSTGMKKNIDNEQLGFSKLLLLVEKNRVKDTYNDATIFMTLSIKKDTDVKDYDVPVYYFKRGLGMTFADTRIKYDEKNKVRLELFKQ